VLYDGSLENKLLANKFDVLLNMSKRKCQNEEDRFPKIDGLGL
jgi:hypothetical protein